jgi:hypothetical protein
LARSVERLWIERRTGAEKEKRENSRAELAARSSGFVHEIATVKALVLRHVVAAGAARWLEVEKLNVRADDVGVADGGGEHAFDEVGEGRHAILFHPSERSAGESSGGTRLRKGGAAKGRLTMKIQNRGSVEGPKKKKKKDDKALEIARTHPQKIKHNEKSKLAMLPAVSDDSIPAMIIEVKVEVCKTRGQRCRVAIVV